MREQHNSKITAQVTPKLLRGINVVRTMSSLHFGTSSATTDKMTDGDMCTWPCGALPLIGCSISFDLIWPKRNLNRNIYTLHSLYFLIVPIVSHSSACRGLWESVIQPEPVTVLLRYNSLHMQHSTEILLWYFSRREKKIRPLNKSTPEQRLWTSWKEEDKVWLV